MTPLGFMKKHKIAVAIFGLVAIAAVAIAVFAGRGDSVEWSEPIRRGAVIESVYGIGTVTATRSFQLKTAVPSTVRHVHVQEGDYVRRGQQLVELDGVGSFRAPFAGTVTSLPLKVGETVFAQSVVLELVDLLDRYLVVSLEQRGAVRVRRGQRAQISFEAMRGEAFQGSVESVYSRQNDFLVRIDVSKLPPQVLPGMTADVAIGIAERDNALLVPVAAINAGKVRVRRGSDTEEVAVTTGVVDGAMAEIVAGDVREGDRVVVPRKEAS